MALHNEFNGYVKLPQKELYHARICVEFNGSILSEPGAAKIEGFTLRMRTVDDDFKLRPEMSVTLRAEQWLDLVDAMKEEFEAISEYRKEEDDHRKEE